MAKKIKTPILAKMNGAAKAEKDPASLVKCEVQLERGDWVSPASCQVFLLARRLRVQYWILSSRPTLMGLTSGVGRLSGSLRLAPKPSGESDCS